MFYIILDLKEKVHMLIAANSEGEAAKLAIEYIKYYKGECNETNESNG